MNLQFARATSIGHIASQVLRRNSSALVSGRSSRGLYLQPEGDLILYLTDEPYRGPLTINIRGEGQSLSAIQTGDAALFQDNQIQFPGSDLLVQGHSPLIWKPCQAPLPQQFTRAALDRIADQVVELVPDHPYLPLLETASSAEARPVQGIPGLSERIIQLSKSLQSGNPSQIISEMMQLLGVGPGLTPLGDDLLLGALLAIGRARRQQFWTGDLVHFHHAIISAAEEKTTRISWSLLSCAVQDSADERIIRVLDGLIASREIPTADLENLLAWGSSSGMAVLVGMLVGLT